MEGDYGALKQVIIERSKAREKECVNTDPRDEILRVQGAARELEQLLSVMERMENPQEPEKE